MSELTSGKKDKLKIPLFWKFTVGMVVVVVLFGSINVALVHRIIFSSLEEELQQKGVFMSQIISQRAVNYILFDDIVSLNVLIDEVKSADSSIEYILICDPDCEIKAHTFDGVMPAGLREVHDRQVSSEILSAHVRFKDSEKLIRDISIPLLEGSIGFLRVGITEDNISTTLNKATNTLLGMILILVFISLVGTFIFSYLVTSPVKAISNIADNLDMDSIRDKKVMFASRYPTRLGKVMNLLPGDEIDILVSRFNEMVNRLQKAYDELETAQKKLLQSEKLASIGMLAAGVAHEVNNPIAGIMNCIARIKKNPERKEEAEKYLELMEEATLKVEKVVKNLLNFARKPETSKADVNLNMALLNSVSLVRHLLDKENIKLFSGASLKNQVVYGNQNLIEQVFLNIILNAIDAVAERKVLEPELEGEIILSSRKTYSGSKLVIELKDNGTGVPKEYIDRIMDPFFTTKPAGKGTGLGLSVCLNIINEHGGDMEIESELNAGTTVRIVLPLKLST